jgi:hypothetical protein
MPLACLKVRRKWYLLIATCADNSARFRSLPNRVSIYSNAAAIRRITAAVGLRGGLWFVPTARTTVSMAVRTVSSRASCEIGEEARWRETEIDAKSGTAGNMAVRNSQRFDPDEPDAISANNSRSICMATHRSPWLCSCPHS